MSRKGKRTKKLRGSRLHGFGKQRQHRGKGRKGGAGKAGRHKHKWTWTRARSPDYFGRRMRGFRGRGRGTRTINLHELEERLDGFLEEGVATRSEEGVIEVDVSKAGYDKVLGSGELSKPIIIRSRSFSKAASDKIERAGGKALEA